MKKMIASVLCLVLALSLVGCGSNKDKKSEKKGEEDTTVKIDDVVYYNTKKAVPVEPDESAIVNAELPLYGSMSDEKITAYAFTDDTLFCLIDGEWYQFIVTDRAGQP